MLHRTMYRILAEHAEVRERRNQLRHPAYHKPELLATGPNQVWSWDITKLRGPSKGVYYYLYVILDIYSRYVVGWMIAEVESAELAEQLIAETCAKQGVATGPTHDSCRQREPDDRQIGGHLAGRPGRGEEPLPAARFQRQPVLGGAVQNAQVPAGLPGPLRQPGRCPPVGAAASSPGTTTSTTTRGLGLLTPADVHTGRAETVRQQRQVVLQQAYQAHPERFVQACPRPAKLPAAAWINPPRPKLAQPRRRLCQPTAVQPAQLHAPADLRYTPVGGPEDRATLRSDSSAESADGVAGQSRCQF